MRKILRTVCSAAFAFMFTAAFFSCIDVDSTQESENDNCIVTLSVFESSDADRTAMPETYEWEYFNYKLEAAKIESEPNVSLSKSWDSYDLMNKEELLLDAGNWKFTLDALKDGATVFTGETTAEIKKGDNTVSIALAPPQTGTGSLNMSLTGINGSANVIATLCSLDGEPIAPSTEESWSNYNQETNGELTQSWNLTAEQVAENSGTITFSRENVPKGSYMLVWEFTIDSAALRKIRPVAIVEPGRSSSESYNVNGNTDGLKKFYSVSYDLGVVDDTIVVTPADALTDKTLYAKGDLVTIKTFNLTREGYFFAGWKLNSVLYQKPEENSSAVITFPMDDSSVVLKAEWKPDTDTPYKIRHWKQKLNAEETNVSGIDKTIVEDETPTCQDYELAGPVVIGYGTTKEQTEAREKDYEGFEKQDFSQKEIAADGSTVVDIFYNRKYFTLSYFDNIDNEEIYVPVPIEKCYGAKVAVNFEDIGERTDYTFEGWAESKDASIPLYTSPICIPIEGNKELFAVWSSNIYTVTFDGNGGSFVENEQTLYESTQQFEKGISKKLLQNKFTSVGHAFKGWSKSPTGEKELDDTALYTATGDITLYAVWNPVVDYTVYHWQQNVEDDSYTEVVKDRQTLQGELGAQTEAQANTYDGFTVPTPENVTIEDENTTVNIYYNRRTYTVNYVSSNQPATVPTDNTEYRFGADVTVLFDAASRQGYTLNSWSGQIGNEAKVFEDGKNNKFKMPAGNVTLNAVWLPNSNTKYIVRHWKQKLNDTKTDVCGTNKEITEPSENNESPSCPHYYLSEPITPCEGKTADYTKAEAKDYEGFDKQDFSQKEIAADDSTIIDIFYDRHKYTLSYDDGDSKNEISVPESSKWCYGATVTVDFVDKDGNDMNATVGLKTGYTFLGWGKNSTTLKYTFDGEKTFEMGAEDVHLIAVWEANEIGDGGITIKAPEYSDVSLELTGEPAAGGGAVRFTVASGCDSYKWYVDGSPSDEEFELNSEDASKRTYIWNCSSKGPDTYNIMLLVTKKVGEGSDVSEIYSATIDVEIRKK